MLSCASCSCMGSHSWQARSPILMRKRHRMPHSWNTVQPKNNARARTSFCVRKTTTSCGYLRDACARILQAARTSLRFEVENRKNCFALTYLDRKNFFAIKYLVRKNFFAVATLKRRNTPLLIGRHSRNKVRSVNVWLTVLCETKRNEMVLCEMVLCEMVLCEMVLCEMVLCEMDTTGVQSLFGHPSTKQMGLDSCPLHTLYGTLRNETKWYFAKFPWHFRNKQWISIF